MFPLKYYNGNIIFMPKYRGEWDPIDDPSIRDLQNREDLEQVLQREIADLYEETDEYLLKEYGGAWPDPDDLFVKIGKIKKRMKPLPRSEQTGLQRRISGAEVRIIKYSVFYWQAIIDRFGFRIGREKSPREYGEYVGDELKMGLTHFLAKLDKVKFPDVVSSLESQLDRLERYRKEPQAYNFDERSDELQKIIFDKLSYSSFFRNRETRGLADSRRDREEGLRFFTDLKEKIGELEAIADKMTDEEIKTDSRQGVEFLKSKIERLEFEESSVDLLAGYRASLGDLRYRADQGEDISEETSALREILQTMLIQAQAVRSGTVLLFEDLLSQINRLEKKQKPLPEEDWQGELRTAERQRDLSLAYAVLGVFEDEPARETVKKARNDLARKFHTDLGGDETKIKQINAAYELIERVRGWK